MKISICFVVFSTIIFLTLAFSENMILEESSDNKVLSNYVCNITKAVLKLKTDTQDVLISNLGYTDNRSDINGIIECLGDVSAVIVSDFKKQLIERSLRKAAVIIFFIFNSLNKVILNFKF